MDYKKHKSVGIITFHSSHNYGAMLQAYALQTTIKSYGYECTIINYISQNQKNENIPFHAQKGLSGIVKNAYHLLTYKRRKAKYNKFEEFRLNCLNLSPEYNTVEEIEEKSPQYDYYISGSDQVWNTRYAIASPAYFLSFVKTGVKLSYAASFGNKKGYKYTKETASLLKDFDLISVREESGKEIVKEMTGKAAVRTLDPVWLLNKEQWEELIEEKPIVNGDYIFFYTPTPESDYVNRTVEVSKATGLAVINSKVSNRYEAKAGFKEKSNAGPREFLNYIKNARLVCTSSFHAIVFSIILDKPFLAMGGMEDDRMSTVLKLTGLEDRAIDKKSSFTGKDDIFKADYTDAKKRLGEEIEKSKAFLRKALSLEK